VLPPDALIKYRTEAMNNNQAICIPRGEISRFKAFLLSWKSSIILNGFTKEQTMIIEQEDTKRAQRGKNFLYGKPGFWGE